MFLFCWSPELIQSGRGEDAKLGIIEREIWEGILNHLRNFETSGQGGRVGDLMLASSEDYIKITTKL